MVHLGTPAVSAQVKQFALAGQATQTLSPRLYYPAGHEVSVTQVGNPVIALV